MLGNPGGRELWRWGAGVKPAVSRFRGRSSSSNVEMDYKQISFSFNSFGGNSGGPVLNPEGHVVGVLRSGGGEGGIYAYAVHWSEIERLLSTISRRCIFSVENLGNDRTVAYEIRWGDGEWKTFSLGSRESSWHSYTCAATAPQIRFDSSLEDGYQLKTYKLQTYAADLGENVKPSIEQDAREYLFVWDRRRRNVDLQEK